MIRKPLRPLAIVLPMRQSGGNPDKLERENIRERHEKLRDSQRLRAESRLLFVGLLFFLAFGIVGFKMVALASSEVAEPRASTSGAKIVAQRSNILDREGRVLATNLITNALYAQPPLMVQPEKAATELAAIFPDLDAEDLKKQFQSERKFLWIKKKISPEQMQKVHEIGDPGLQFGSREMRLYPNGKLASHVLGGAGFGREGVLSAEVVGKAGVELAFDEFLRDPAMEGQPLQLSMDLTIQSAVRPVLYGGMRLLNAKGATSVLMDVNSGEVISMVSLPDFDPNSRPVAKKGKGSDQTPVFNRAVQGVYELGSTFKLFTLIQAIELGLVNQNTMIDTKGPMKWGKFKIRDHHDNGPELSVRDVLVESSNIGTARVAKMIGEKRQKEFLKSLGLFETTSIEMNEAKTGRPLLPPKWSELSTLTVSYGHGLAASPLHLAQAYASIVNGGTLVEPTLLKGAGGGEGPRVISEKGSEIARDMLEAVVQEGTASFARIPGYGIGGKTGTADKPKPGGGYHDDKVLATFAAVFPIDKPKYVLVVTLDEPVETSGPEPRRTAGWTAVPVAAEIINRVAPLLGLVPEQQEKTAKSHNVKF